MHSFKSTITLVFILLVSVTLHAQNLELNWFQQYSGPLVPSDDEFAAMSPSSDGGIYVAGTVGSRDMGDNICIIKYNPDGTEQWHAYYDNSYGLDDRGEDLVSTADGGVMVLGTSHTPEGGSQITCLKYDSSGNLNWNASLGPSSDDAEAVAISLDSDENLLVIANIGEMDEDQHFQVIKLDTEGAEIWTAESDNGGGHGLSLVDMALDNHDNIHIAAYQNHEDGDFLVYKYNSEGTLLWNTAYDPEGSIDVWYSDKCLAGIALDDSSNVYISGSSRLIDDPWLQGVLLKYDQNGNLVWSVTNDIWPIQIKVHPEYGIFLTGTSHEGSFDNKCQTARYNFDGNLYWLTGFQGGNWGNDGSELCISSSGDVFVAGIDHHSCAVGFCTRYSTYFAIKYDLEGTELWNHFFTNANHNYSGNDEPGMLLQDSSIFMGGYGRGWLENSFDDIFLIQTDLLGNEIGVSVHNGPDVMGECSVDQAHQSSGNTYLLTEVETPDQIIYGMLLAYASNGEQLAEVPIGHADNRIFCVDDLGDMYVANFNRLYKIDLAGDTLWTYEASEEIERVKVRNNEIYVLGLWIDVAVNSVWIDKLASNGTVIWNTTHTPFTALVSISDIEVDENGEIGLLVDSEGSNPDGVIKISSEGDVLFSETFGQFLDDIAFGWNGEIYLAGRVNESPYDLGNRHISKLRPDGEMDWEILNYAFGDGPSLIHVGVNWNVYASAPTSDGFVVASFDPAGLGRWQYNNEIEPIYNIQSMLEGPSGDLYVMTNSEFTEIWSPSIFRFTVGGDLLLDHDVDVDDHYYGISVFLDQNNLLLVGTKLGNSGGHWNYSALVQNYLQQPLTRDGSGIKPLTYELRNAYPNPFNPTTTIEYDLPEYTEVNLEVFDATGRHVATLVKGNQSAGSYEAQWNGIDKSGNPVSTGVYFCRLKAGVFNQTIKMVYLR